MADSTAAERETYVERALRGQRGAAVSAVALALFLMYPLFATLRCWEAADNMQERLRKRALAMREPVADTAELVSRNRVDPRVDTV